MGLMNPQFRIYEDEESGEKGVLEEEGWEAPGYSNLDLNMVKAIASNVFIDNV